MLTLDDIRQQATAASFSKGRAYFEEGAVGRVRHRTEDDYFSATVSGTEDYDVELTLTEDGPDFWCNCPYDYEGICKHAVALGLAVLEKLEVAAASPNKAKSALKKTLPAGAVAAPEVGLLSETVSASELEAALRDVPKPEQLKFLALQLRQNPSLAQVFLTQFIGPPLPPDPLDADPTLPRLEDLRDPLRRALSRLRFDYNALAEDGTPPRVVFTFGKNGSRFLQALEQQIALVLRPVLQPVADEIQNALTQGRLAEALRRWHGAWLGISSLKMPANDSYNLFYGNYYSRHVAEAWLALLTESGVMEQLGRQAFEPREVARCQPVFVRAVTQSSSAEVVARPAPAGPPAPLPDIDLALLLAVAVNPTVAPALHTTLRVQRSRALPLLQLRLAEGRRDWTAWEPLATQLAASNPQVLLELLHFYLRANRPAELVALAEKHFAKNLFLLSDFVLAHLMPAHSRLLYVRALTVRLEKHADFADFEALAELWTEEERAKFVQRALGATQPPFPALFRARVLAASTRAAEILPLILTVSWHTKNRYSYWNTPSLPLDLSTLPELLQLTARFQPEATLDAVMERIESYLEQHSLRSVELYQHMAQWLKALWELPVLQEQVMLFAEGLAVKYSRLSHLRRELREAELLPEPTPLPPKLPRPGTAPRSGRKAKNPFGR